MLLLTKLARQQKYYFCETKGKQKNTCAVKQPVFKCDILRKSCKIISMKTVNPKGFWYDSVGSTMDEAKRLIQAGQVKDIAFVVANHQTCGRGTYGRQWDSPEGAGIYLSVVHVSTVGTESPRPYMELTTLYTKACGVACVEAIKEITNIETKLKPINDIYFNGKKLGGILVESRLEKKGFSSLITGVGINTHNVVHDLDRNIVEPVSLEQLLSPEGFKRFSKEKLIEGIVSKICFWYEVIFNGKQDLVQEKWESYKL